MSNQAREIMGRVLDDKFRGTWTCLNYQDLVVFSEKYMELVVRECAEMVRIQNEQFMENESHYGVVSTDLLKHFGLGEK
jgi:hypothetical protein